MPFVFKSTEENYIFSPNGLLIIFVYEGMHN